MDEGDENEEEI